MSETTSLYDQFKERIKSHALYAKYAALELKNRKCAEYIFGVETTDDELYQKVIWKIEQSAQRQVEWLFVQLCIKYGYPVVPPDRESKCTCDHDILFEKGDKIIQVDFKSVLRPSDLFINRPKSKNKRPRRAPIRETDTYLVYLLKKNEEGYTWLEQRTSSDDLAKAVLVSDFISEVFGEEEGMRFDVAMSCFSEDMRDALGYRITQIGTEQALKELRNTLAVELPDYGYDAIRHFNDKAAKKKVYVTDSVFQEMSQRFATNYKMLVGNSDFAISLLTSEWLYRQYGTIPGLDNTYVVTGYCKSIEQLLWRIISVVGKGRKIGLSNSEVGDNTSASDTTLGALKYFLNATKNADLFNKIFGDNTFYVQRYLNYQLSEWIEHERNGNFHKHNLTPERVGIIREQTLYLYFLILGSLTLTNDTIALLME